MMKEDKQKRIIKEAMTEFFRSEEGEALIGNMVLTAIRIHFSGYELAMEKTHPDGGVEKYTQTGDPLALICKWIKDAEGAIRGCQSDSAKSRNYSANMRDMLAAALTGQKLVDVTPQSKQIGQNDGNDNG